MPLAATAPEAERPGAATPRTALAGQAINIRLEVSVGVQQGQTTSARKTVTLVLADRESGQVRSQGVIPATVVKDSRVTNVSYDLDALASVVDAGRVRASLSLRVDLPEHATGDAVVNPVSSVQERFTVVLDNGKPLVVTQSADPLTDRIVTVEIKATILR